MLTFLAAMLLAISPGQPVPALKGEYLSGKKAILPDAAKGKWAMYCVGFSYDSRFPIEAWVERYKKDFFTNPAITFFEVPVIGGFGMLGKPFIDSGMRRGTPKQLHENVLTVYGGAGDLKKAFGATNDKFAYILLADPQGIVRWSYSGMFDEAKYLEFKKATEELLAPR